MLTLRTPDEFHISFALKAADLRSRLRLRTSPLTTQLRRQWGSGLFIGADRGEVQMQRLQCRSEWQWGRAGICVMRGGPVYDSK